MCQFHTDEENEIQNWEDPDGSYIQFIEMTKPSCMECGAHISPADDVVHWDWWRRPESEEERRQCEEPGAFIQMEDLLMCTKCNTALNQIYEDIGYYTWCQTRIERESLIELAQQGVKVDKNGYRTD